MSNPNPLIVALLVTLTTASAARAQGPQAIEVGGGIGTAISWWGALGGGDVRVTVPLNPRFAVEGFVAILAADTRVTNGAYAVQIKQRLRRGAGPASHAFMTYGVMGGFTRYRTDEYRYTANGSPVVIPARTYSSVSPPVIGLIGGGVQRDISRHLAVRVEAQAVMLLVLPVAARLAVGVSVPLGHLK